MSLIAQPRVVRDLGHRLRGGARVVRAGRLSALTLLAVFLCLGLGAQTAQAQDVEFETPPLDAYFFVAGQSVNVTLFVLNRAPSSSPGTFGRPPGISESLAEGRRFIWSGTPTTPGTYDVRVVVAQGPSKNITVTVLPAGSMCVDSGSTDLCLAAQEDIVLDQGEAVSIQLPAAVGGTAPYTYTLTGALPAGVSFSASDRRLSGSPTASQAAVTYTYRAGDGEVAAGNGPSVTFTITVRPAITIGFEFTMYSADEDIFGGESEVCVRASEAVPVAVDVNFALDEATATEPEDYRTPSPATIRIAAGDTTACVGLPIVNDADVELDERFVARLVSLDPGQGFVLDPARTEASVTIFAEDVLGGLALSEGILSPGFAGGTLAYTAIVPHSVSSLTVTPESVSDATITVNGATVASGSASGAIALTVGANTLTVVATVPSASIPPTATYTVTVTRASATASMDATLSGLEISAGTLNPTFASGTTSYTARVASVASLSVTPTANDDGASIAVNGSAVPSGTASSALALTVGANTVTILVIAEDGSAMTYTVTITRAVSVSIGHLSALVGQGFEGDPRILLCVEATQEVSTDVAVTFSVEEDTATDPEDFRAPNPSRLVIVRGQALGCVDIRLVDDSIIEGDEQFFVNLLSVSPQATATEDISLNPSLVRRGYVIRASDAGLTGLALSEGMLAPDFATGTTAYTALVTTNATSLTVTPEVASGVGATITVNGNAVSSGAASAAIALTVGANTITVVVTVPSGGTDSTETYTVTVTRRAAVSSDATLSGLSISPGSLSPTFASGTMSYTASVANSATTVTVTPTTSDALATIAVTSNGTTVTASAGVWPAPVSVGANTIEVTVTAEDGATTETYTVTVTRAAPPAVTASGTYTVAEDAAVDTGVGAALAAANFPGSGAGTWSITAGNTGGAFSITAAGQLQVAAGLDFETTPSYTLTVRFARGGAMATAQVTVTVTDFNEPPEAVGPIDAQAVVIGSSVAVDASLFFLDPEGDSITYSVVVTSGAGSATATVNAASGRVAITGTATGLATVQVTATSSGGTAMQDIDVTVLSSPMVFGDTAGEVSERANSGASSMVGGALAAGGLATANVVAQTDEPGTYGAFSVTEAGVWTYVLDNRAPATDALDAGETVTEAFTVVAADDSTVTTTVTVTVRGVNDHPVFRGSTTLATLTLGTTRASTTFDLRDTFRDPEGHSMTYYFTETTAPGCVFGAAALTPSLRHQRTVPVRHPLGVVIASGTRAGRLCFFGEVTDSGGAVLDISDALGNLGVNVNAAPQDGTMFTGNTGRADATDPEIMGTIAVPEGVTATFAPQTGVPGDYGTFSLTGAGDWTYSVDLESPNYATLWGTSVSGAGRDTLPFVASVGATNPVATPGAVTVTVFGRDDPPVVARQFSDMTLPVSATAVEFPMRNVFFDPDGGHTARLRLVVASSDTNVLRVELDPGRIISRSHDDTLRLFAEAPGTATVTLTANDVNGAGSVAQTFEVVVELAGAVDVNLAAITGDDAVNIAERAAGFQISGTNQAGAAVSVTVGAGSARPAAVSGTGWTVDVPAAAAEVTGTSVVVVATATLSGETTGTARRTLTVDQTAPTASWALPPTLTAGHGIALVPTASADVAGYAVQSGALPPGLTVEPMTGIILGRPAAANSATTAVTIRVTDAAGNTADVALTFPAVAANTLAKLRRLSISPGSLMPAFASGTTSYTASVVGTVGSVAVTATATDDESSISVTANGTSVAPAGGVWPAPVTVGANAIVVTVTAEDGAAMRAYTVTVTRASVPAVMASGAYTVAEDAAVDDNVGAALVAANFPGSGGAWSITAGNTGGAFKVTAAGQLQVAAALDFETTPSYTLTAQFAQGGAMATASVAVTVTDVNEPPEAVGDVDDQTVTAGGAPASVDVSGSFADPEGDAITYSVAVTSGTDVASASVNAAGVVTILGLSVGSATVTVTATSTGGAATQAIAVTVDPGEVAFTSNTGTAAADSAQATGTLAATGGEPVTYSAQTSADTVYGTITLTAAGEWTYTLDTDNEAFIALAEGVVGMDAIEFSASVGAQNPRPATGMLTITVTGRNDAPEVAAPIGSQSATAGGDNIVVELADVFSDPDTGDTLSFRVASSDTSVATAAVSSPLTVTPVGAGTATITVTATDSGSTGLTVTDTFEVTVNPAAAVAVTLAPDIAGDDVVNIAERASGFSIAGTTEAGAQVSVTVGAGSAAAATVTSTDWALAVPAASSDIAGTRVDVVATATLTGKPDGTARRTVMVDLVAPTAAWTPPTALMAGSLVTVRPSGASADVAGYAVQSGRLPPGLALDRTTGVVSGRPTTANPAETPVTIRITDAAGNTADVDVAFPAVMAAANRPPATPSLADRTATVGVAFAYRFGEVRDPDRDAVRYTAALAGGGALPGWLSFAASARAFSGTPEAVDVGEVRVRVTATDDGEPPLGSSGDFTIVVRAAPDVQAGPEAGNRAPVAVRRIADRVLAPGERVAFDAAAFFRDPDGDPLAFAAESADASVAAAGLAGSLLTLSGDVAGATRVTVVATDPDGLSARQAFAVRVAEPEAQTAPEVLDDAVAELLLNAGESRVLDLAALFAHADGIQALSFSVESDGAGVATAEIDAEALTVVGVGSGAVTATVTATDGAGRSATHAIVVRVNEGPSVLAAAMADVALDAGGDFTLDLAEVFTDPDGFDTLAFEAATDDAGVATVRVDGATLSIAAVASGAATATVVATDPRGLSASHAIAVSANGAPAVRGGAVAALSLEVGRSETVDLAGVFADPDGFDTLTLMATSSAASVASASVVGASLTVSGLAVGEAQATLTAADERGLSATHSIQVTVSLGAAFRDGAEAALGGFARAVLTGATGAVGERIEGPGGGGRTGSFADLLKGVAGRAGSVGTQRGSPDPFGSPFDSAAGPPDHAPGATDGSLDAWHAGAASVRDGAGNRAVSGPGAMAASGGWSGLDHGAAYGASGARDSGLDALLRRLPRDFAVGGGSGRGAWSVWGRWDGQSLDGARYDLDASSVHVGADMQASDRLVLGVALARHGGDAGFGAYSMDAELTAFTPYVRFEPDARTALWALGGFGGGEADVATGAGVATSDLDLGLLALGARRELMRSGALRLDFKGDYARAELETASGDGAAGGLSADASRLRAALEGSAALSGGRVAPFASVGARRDGGTDLSGTGFEVAAGLRLTAGALDLEASARTLLAHSEDDYDETGYALRAELRAAPDGTGASFSLTPRWGANASSAGDMFQHQWTANAYRRHGASRSLARQRSIAARFGYGFVAGQGRYLATPFAAYEQGGADRLALSLGLDLVADGVDLRLVLGAERGRDDKAELGPVIGISGSFAR